MDLKKLFSWLFRLGISVAILYYLFTKVSLSQVINSISSAKISYVLIGYSISLFMSYLKAYRLKLLTDRQGMTLSSHRIFEVNLGIAFYNLFLPAAILTGGLIRWYKLAKHDGKLAAVIASVVFDRLIDTITLCALGMLFWLLDKPYNQSYIGLSLGAVLSGLLIVYAFVFTGAFLTHSKDEAGLISLSFLPNVLISKLNNLIASFSQLHNLSWGYIVLILFLSLSFHLIGIVGFSYLFILSLDIHIPIIAIAWIRSVRMLLAMLPIHIAGFGVREGALVFLLGLYGVPAEDAIALSFIYLGSVLLTGAIGGTLEAKNLLWQTESRIRES